MPYMCWSLLRSMQWSVVSKAAERSKSARSETFPVKCKKDVICHFEKSCFCAVVRAISALRETDDVVFRKVSKQLLKND